MIVSNRVSSRMELLGIQDLPCIEILRDLRFIPRLKQPREWDLFGGYATQEEAVSRLSLFQDCSDEN